MKNLFSIVLGIIMVVTAFSGTTVFASQDITVELDGKTLEFDVSPQIVDNRTMVPLRTIFEEIGALVKWNGDTKTVSAKKNSKTITLVIGSDGMLIDKGKTDDNGNPVVEAVVLDVPAKLEAGRTLVPVRAIAESFGLNVEWDGKNKKVVILSENDDDNSWEENIGFINLTDLTFEGKGIEIKNDKIMITAGGDYTLSGTLANGNIEVSSKEKVKLRLNGVQITSEKDACVYVAKADKAYITLCENTKNSLVAKNSKDGAIYSKADLEIKGNGALDVVSENGHGIKASDNLNIENGKIKINAFNDGIHINDTFKMTGGEVDITSVGDGVDSESIVNILGGSINIVTNGIPLEPEVKSDAAAANANNRRPMWEEETADVEFEKSTKGIAAEWMLCISNGKLNINSASHAIRCQDEIQIDSSNIIINSKYDKGISANGSLTINGADTVIDIQKSVEGLESKNVLTINDGYIKIVSIDDAINSTGGKSGQMFGPGFGGNGGKNDKNAQSDGWRNNQQNRNPGSLGNASGEKTPQRDPNGRQPNKMPDFKIPSDGNFMPWFDFNQNGGFVPSDASRPSGAGTREPQWQMPQGTMGQGGRGNSKDCIIVNGGKIEVFAGDDCIDANGNIAVNAGTIAATIRTGSFYGNFGILDADGSLKVGEKANLIFAAQNGNANGLNLAQNYIIVYGSESHNAGDKITVCDSSGNIVYSYTPDGGYKAVLVALNNIKIGEKYSITLGTETFEADIKSQATTVGTAPSGGNSQRVPGMWQR